MIVLEVSVNGRQHVRCGVENLGVLSAILAITKSAEEPENEAPVDINLELGGLDAPPAGPTQSLKWRSLPIRVGDDITIAVRSGKESEPPESIAVEDEAKKREQKRKYLIRLQSELGEV